MDSTKDELIYLDNAATTQLDEDVLAEMLPYLMSKYGNPSSVHPYGLETRMAIELARKGIATLLGVKPQTIIFTSGGTESNNTAILTSIRDFQCDHVITSKIEHHSVLHVIEHYSRQYKFEISYVDLNSDGSLNYGDFERKLKDNSAAGKKCLVSLMHGNNEIGNQNEIGEIGAICKTYEAFFHSDCVQTIGHYPLNLSQLNIHFASASAHKFHGPKGVGILYVHEDLKTHPLIWGGGHERNRRAGTENVAGIVGMAKALQLSHDRYTKQISLITDLKNYFISNLLNTFPGVIINGGNNSLYSILSVSFPKTRQSETLLSDLNQEGICAAGGSACSGGSSHVMQELGRINNYTTVRFSFSRFNTIPEINRVMAILKKLLQTTAF
jgi:cysteine desulfurase